MNAAAPRSDVSLGTPIPSIDPTGAMLVRHGQASIEVKAVDDAVTRMRQTAAQFGGFVANTAVRTGKDEQRSAMLQLRVPSAQFDGAVAALSQLGKVESVSVNAEDVAEEYVDLGARLANARRVEARLVELLATRTGRLSDVLTIEQELARVRQEAERYEARMRWLERRASLSSLDVSIHEKLPLIDSPSGRGPILEAFAEAWERMVSFVAWLIAMLGILVPLGVLFLARDVHRAQDHPRGNSSGDPAVLVLTPGGVADGVRAPGVRHVSDPFAGGAMTCATRGWRGEGCRAMDLRDDTEQARAPYIGGNSPSIERTPWSPSLSAGMRSPPVH